MLQLYSSGISVNANELVPFNSFAVRTVGPENYISPTSIQLVEPGIYFVSVDGYAEAAAAGEITLQLVADGVQRPEVITSVTGAVGETDSFHFDTLVPINGCCCGANPKILQILNAGVAVTGMHINWTVYKIR